MIQRVPEVLAPAGSYDIMLSAFQAGADAVYLGGRMYGARAYASNLSDQELIHAIEYAASHHKKVYLTVNTLLKDEEIDRLSVFLKEPYEAGLDGVIVQDLGAASLIRKIFPQMEVHASTQMTITSPAAALKMKEMGMTRVVPARELSIDEIRKIRKISGLEVEVFVHGALCYCYSGQCLLSSMIGGRSGNRGTCAQPCRQLYRLKQSNSEAENIQKARYYLSPKDLCGLPAIPELIGIGVDSLKIEGRMKNAEYVISAVQAYRRAVDACMKKEEFDVVKEQDRLADIFNRGNFTEGYYRQYHGLSMMSMDRNHHNGLYIGKIVKINGGTFDLELCQKLDQGDILEIRTGNGSYVELTSGQEGRIGDIVTLHGKQMRSLSVGMRVYRTKHPALCNELSESNARRQLKEIIHISVICKKDLPVTITMSCDDHSVTVTGPIAEHAQSRPVTKEDLQDKLYKIGDYPFTIDSVAWDVEPDVFISMKDFNRLRRKAMEELEYALRHSKRRVSDPNLDHLMENSMTKASKTTVSTSVGLSVYIAEPNQLDPVMECTDVTTIGLEVEYLSYDQVQDLIGRIRSGMDDHRRNLSVILAFPHIYRMNMQEDMERYLSLHADGCLVRTMDELCIVDSFRSAHQPELAIILDSSVYAYNRLSVEYYRQNFGIQALTLPVEYAENDLMRLFRASGNCDWQSVIYGHQMVMVSAQCVYLNTDQCRQGSDPQNLVNDHDDELTVERICKYCYNVLYQKNPVCLFEMKSRVPEFANCGMRMHFLHESADTIRNLLAYSLPDAYTYGRYLKGI